jgi:CobQ-like glutamine amidotransferase family enzyme
MLIEVLFPDVANLHGDLFNTTYLAQCRPDAVVTRTALNDPPAFASKPVDLVYLGPMPERAQLWVIDRLLPYRTRLEELIASGTVFLFTHNAMEVLGESIRNDAQNYEAPGLGLLPIRSKVLLCERYNGKVMGQAFGTTVVGYKSQFSRVTATAEIAPFLVADKGVGRDEHTTLEGVRMMNFFGTSLLGPLLINNPDLTLQLLRLLDPDTEPTLAHEPQVRAAYRARLADFNDPKRWHPAELVRG